MSALQQTLDGILERHAGRTYTAAALRVTYHATVIAESAVGVADPATAGSTCTLLTSFDLASLTKLFTSAATLRLVAGRELQLPDPIGRFLPEVRSTRAKDIRVRHLLAHNSGLPPTPGLHARTAAEKDPWAALFGVELLAPAGQTVVYSDVGFILLAEIVRRVAGASLPQAMEQLLIRPLGLDASYGPCPEAAATEFDPWRGRRLRGEVHDESAAVLGGAAGHAGLFGTVSDVWRLARAYVDREVGFLPARLIAAATGLQAGTGSELRGLGWKLRSPDAAAPEAALSRTAFGHYGFTGTAVWVDPFRDVTVVLLTNRVYFGRDPHAIREARREILSSVAIAFPQVPAG